MENREKIMQCAEDLFYSRGYDATGVQEIVDRAGISKPTLYYYFGSKLGLLQAIVDTKSGKLRPGIRAVVASNQDIRGKLYDLARVYHTFWMEDHKFYMLLMALFYSARENEAYQAVKPCLTEFYGGIVSIFESCAEELGNMNGRQKQFALSFIGVINQHLMLGLGEDNGPSGVGEEQLCGVVDQFMYGIFS